MSGKVVPEDHKITNSQLQTMNKLNEEMTEKLMKNWSLIHGPLSVDLQDRLNNVQDDLKQFWDDQLEASVNEKKDLMDNISSLGKEAFNLEKALNLPNSSSSNSLLNAPLLQLEEELKKLISSYNEIKKERLKEYMELRDQETELCNILNETPQLIDYSNESNTKIYIPSGDDVKGAVTRIKDLKNLQNELESQFLKLKYELREILEECEIKPFNKVECAVFDQDVVFPCTKLNLEALLETTDSYRLTRADRAAKADELRLQVSSLWNKMMKDKGELKEFISVHNDFKKSTIKQLEKTLNDLKAERKENMKELIVAIRIALDELWTRCCFSDDQRAQFKPYYANHYTEDVLDLHELEVDRLNTYYDQYKQIYQLASRHEELWSRLLHLEEQAKKSDRLFKNRGGQLLLEEKERKLVQKKLPAIKAELMTLLEQYKMEHGSDFLYFGEPLLDQLEQKEEERKSSKENEKLQRKAANVETLQIESRHGTRSTTTIAGGKRKFLTPQPPNVSNKIIKLSVHTTGSSVNTTTSSKGSSQQGRKVNKEEAATLRKRMQSPSRQGFTHTPRTPGKKTQTASRTPAIHTPAIKTPAPSDLNNGSPTYESFQEHMDTVNIENCLSSTKDLGRPAVLRPRNLRSRVESPRVTPYKTPSRTPSKTPTRAPFRIATGSRIPSVVPPISPRSGSKLTATRVKLPIIF